MKKNKIMSIIFMLCMLTTFSCNKKNNQHSETGSFSNKESKDSTLSSSENSTSSNKELDYCYFGDTVYVDEYREKYFISSNLAEINTIKTSETSSIDFEINFSFNIAAAEWEKNPIDYYFSIQYLFTVNASQGTPFYIAKNSDFYEKHFENPMLEFCEQKEKKDYIIKVSIPTDQLYRDCLANSKSSFLFFMPCIYASEDGYSYTNGVKDLVTDFKYNNHTGVFYSLGNDTITFSGYTDW